MHALGKWGLALPISELRLPTITPKHGERILYSLDDPYVDVLVPTPISGSDDM